MRLPFKKLLIWQKGMSLVKMVYQVTRIFPKEELYGLTSQLRRAAVSIPSNIAEGNQRGSEKEFSNYLCIAKGSLAELETQLLLAQELGYASVEKIEPILAQADEMGKMLHAFRATLAIPH